MKSYAAPSPLQILTVIAICFGFSIYASAQIAWFGAPQIAFDSNMLSSMLVFEIVLSLIALTVIMLFGSNVKALFPRPTWSETIYGALLYCGTLLVIWIVLFSFEFTDEHKQAITSIMAKPTPSILWILLLAIVNGWYEEAFILGYLGRFTANHGIGFALGITVLIRVLCHVYQGPIGAISIAVLGVIFGLFYFRTKRLWPVIFAHMLGDVVPFFLH